ncbi:MAG TPA: response regulator [Bryobacteraceae bacterium]|jgi:CheY-like chemotaxis protein|nr:response regulator [Bryobacteraceae bacterium]
MAGHGEASAKAVVGAVKKAKAFRFLVVDDSPADVIAIREALKDVGRCWEVDWVQDGSAALEFLYRRGVYENAARPDLILMDINMPRVTGLEVLSAIKNDPELRVIPAIIFSSSTAPSDVRWSYQAHANSYLQKPTSLEKLTRLVRAIEAFWMDLAVPPPVDGHSGRPIAHKKREAISQDGEPAVAKGTSTSGSSECEEHRGLLDAFGAAVRELLKLHEDQFMAIAEGDGESNRFDLLIHMANEKKQLAKYAYLRHVELHNCAN